MIKDEYSQYIFTENEICDLFLSNPEIRFREALVIDRDINLDPELELSVPHKFKKYFRQSTSLSEFDEVQSSTWLMPKSYQEMDIAKYVIDMCSNEEELIRAGEELLLFQERDMFMMLRYMKYLVDVMRANNILWGVGRGSSTASFVLFLIGIHRINPIYWGLDIKEFLKPESNS